MKKETMATISAHFEPIWKRKKEKNVDIFDSDSSQMTSIETKAKRLDGSASSYTPASANLSTTNRWKTDTSKPLSRSAASDHNEASMMKSNTIKLPQKCLLGSKRSPIFPDEVEGSHSVLMSFTIQSVPNKDRQKEENQKISQKRALFLASLKQARDQRRGENRTGFRQPEKVAIFCTEQAPAQEVESTWMPGRHSRVLPSNKSEGDEERPFQEPAFGLSPFISIMFPERESPSNRPQEQAAPIKGLKSTFKIFSSEKNGSKCESLQQTAPRYSSIKHPTPPRANPPGRQAIQSPKEDRTTEEKLPCKLQANELSPLLTFFSLDSNDTKEELSRRHPATPRLPRKVSAVLREKQPEDKEGIEMATSKVPLFSPEDYVACKPQEMPKSSAARQPSKLLLLSLEKQPARDKQLNQGRAHRERLSTRVEIFPRENEVRKANQQTHNEPSNAPTVKETIVSNQKEETVEKSTTSKVVEFFRETEAQHEEVPKWNQSYVGIPAIMTRHQRQAATETRSAQKRLPERLPGKVKMFQHGVESSTVERQERTFSFDWQSTKASILSSTFSPKLDEQVQQTPNSFQKPIFADAKESLSVKQKAEQHLTLPQLSSHESISPATSKEECAKTEKHVNQHQPPLVKKPLRRHFASVQKRTLEKQPVTNKAIVMHTPRMVQLTRKMKPTRSKSEPIDALPVTEAMEAVGVTASEIAAVVVAASEDLIDNAFEAEDQIGILDLFEVFVPFDEEFGAGSEYGSSAGKNSFLAGLRVLPFFGFRKDLSNRSLPDRFPIKNVLIHNSGTRIPGRTALVNAGSQLCIEDCGSKKETLKSTSQLNINKAGLNSNAKQGDDGDSNLSQKSFPHEKECEAPLNDASGPSASGGDAQCMNSNSSATLVSRKDNLNGENENEVDESERAKKTPEEHVSSKQADTCEDEIEVMYDHENKRDVVGGEHTNDLEQIPMSFSQDSCTVLVSLRAKKSLHSFDDDSTICSSVKV